MRRKVTNWTATAERASNTYIRDEVYGMRNLLVGVPAMRSEKIGMRIAASFSFVQHFPQPQDEHNTHNDVFTIKRCHNKRSRTKKGRKKDQRWNFLSDAASCDGIFG